jgi:large subunit ribosomal protein L4
MEVKIFDKTGKATKNVATLSDAIFGIEPNDHAIYLDVKQHLANRRQGTHKSKERAEISGSTRKLKKQKGTGGARAGSVKSGTRVGGGRIFGPRPRDYHFKLNIKLKRLARQSALAYKAKTDSILVIEDLSVETPRTKDFIALLSNLSLTNEKVLFVVGSNDSNVYMSARNLGRVKVSVASDINTYDVLNAKKIVLAQSSIEVIENILN